MPSSYLSLSEIIPNTPEGKRGSCLMFHEEKNNKKLCDNDEQMRKYFGLKKASPGCLIFILRVY